jgi:hypothetical protein
MLLFPTRRTRHPFSLTLAAVIVAATGEGCSSRVCPDQQYVGEDGLCHSPSDGSNDGGTDGGAGSEPDVYYDESSAGSEAFEADGRIWSHHDLTWCFDGGTDDLSDDSVTDAFLDAAERWAAVSPLTFTFVASCRAADIEVLFATDDHGDGEDFDGEGGTLAHAFYPETSRAGDVHFDDDETWVVSEEDDSQPRDLVSVALHELGHSIGLGHSSERDSVMYYQYRGSRRELSQDDISGVRSIYPDEVGGCTGSVSCSADGMVVSAWGTTSCLNGIDRWSIAVGEDVVYTDSSGDDAVDFDVEIDVSPYPIADGQHNVGLWVRPEGAFDGVLVDTCTLSIERCRASDHQDCYLGDVFWYDSCGVRGSMVYDCTGGETCVDAGDAATCESTCLAMDHQDCYLDDVYWYDSCGVRGSRVYDCTGGETCADAGDTATCEATCVAMDHQDCYLDDVYWYDSCGVRGSRVYDCTGGETCADAGDTATCETTCVAMDHHDCSGGDVYWYDNCGVRGTIVDDCHSVNETCTDAGALATCEWGVTVREHTDSRDWCQGSARDIFRARSAAIVSGTTSDPRIQVTFEKCGGGPVIADKTCHIVVGSWGDSQNPDPNIWRLDFTWNAGLTSRQVTWDMYPSGADYLSAPLGDEKWFHLVCDEPGGDWNHWRTENRLLFEKERL